MIGLVRLLSKKNKNKVKPSVNTILEEFLRETVILNIISLAKTRKIMIRRSGITNYGNHHSIVNNTINNSKFV